MLPRRFLAAVIWTGGLSIIGVGLWLGARAVAAVQLVVVPFAVGLLLVTLLSPLNGWLRRHHLPRALAAVASIAVLLLFLAGVGALTGFRVATRMQDLVEEFQSTASTLQQQLARLSLPVDSDSVTRLVSSLQDSLSSASQGLSSTLIHATQLTLEVVTGVLLALFVAIFVLWDGERIWQWILGLFPSRASRRVGEAGKAAWVSLSGFVQGTFIIATIHAIVIGSALYVLGVPLFMPLALLVFVGSFVPLIGAFVAGGLAVLVTLGTQGVSDALIILVILLIENELEAHVLQPFVVGRYVRLHPLAIILVLTTGSVLAGIPGALLSVPVTGALRAAWGPLNGRTSVVQVYGPSRLSRLRSWLRNRFSGSSQE
jgi:predicted PurR-regulated permease PerM